MTPEELRLWELSECPNGVYPTLDDYARALATINAHEAKATQRPQINGVVSSWQSRVAVNSCASRGYHEVKASEGRFAGEDHIYARLTCGCGAESGVILAFDESAPTRFAVSKEAPQVALASAISVLSDVSTLSCAVSSVESGDLSVAVSCHASAPVSRKRRQR